MSKNVLTFLKYYPGGNTTALVHKPVTVKHMASISGKIMKQHPDIEQVGFVKKNKQGLSLNMMGGEFCLGATVSAAAWHFANTRTNKVSVKVSGFYEPIVLRRKESDHIEATIPRSFFKNVLLRKSNWLVDLEGIRFLISFNRKNVEPKRARILIKNYSQGQAAMGVIYVSGSKNKRHIYPLVWVRQTNSFVKETACGSGSVAVAIALQFHKPGKKIFVLTQPSGYSYSVKISKNSFIFSCVVKSIGQERVGV